MTGPLDAIGPVGVALRMFLENVFPPIRLGIQEERAHPKSGCLVMPSLHRVLYRPWIFYGTPLWEKSRTNPGPSHSKPRKAKTAA